MSRAARDEMASGLSKAALALSTLASIGREYTFEEIAVMTRAAPARLLGLKDRGHLGPGAIADVAVYRRDKSIAKMLGRAAFVFKNGDLVVKDGEITHYRWGRALRLNPPPGQGDGAAARATTTRIATGCRSTGSPSPIPRSRAKNLSARCHAGA